MKTIELNNLTGNQFILHIDLITKIRNKYREKEYVLDYDWNEFRDYYFRVNSDPKEFKERRLKIIEAGKINSLNEYVFLMREI